ncbi:MAG: hypothetical protein CSA66_06430 [Proteobacteria bacterium]|nr:MAG: hypothetical protein CSA66_06430 [Pseudomonadota bacterium]
MARGWSDVALALGGDLEGAGDEPAPTLAIEVGGQQADDDEERGDRREAPGEAAESAPLAEPAGADPGDPPAGAGGGLASEAGREAELRVGAGVADEGQGLHRGDQAAVEAVDSRLDPQGELIVRGAGPARARPQPPGGQAGQDEPG